MWPHCCGQGSEVSPFHGIYLVQEVLGNSRLVTQRRLVERGHISHVTGFEHLFTVLRLSIKHSSDHLKVTLLGRQVHRRQFVMLES